MSDIPFLEELGHQIETAIHDRRARRAPKRSLAAIAAFTAVVVLVGGLAAWQRLGPGPDRPAAGLTATTTPVTVVALDELAERLPSPPGFTSVDDPHGASPSRDLIVRKFTRGTAGSPAAVTVTLARVDAESTPPDDRGKSVALHDHVATIETSDSLVVISWRLSEDVIVEVNGRGWSDLAAVDYAIALDEALVSLSS